MGRRSSGNVRVDSNKGWLRLVWSVQGKRHYLSLGLSDTPINQKLALAKAKIIEVDIATGQFDSTLKRYRPAEVQSSIAVVELFRRFIEHKSKSVYIRTLEKYHALIPALQVCLKGRAARDVSERDIEKLKDYLLGNVEATTAKEKIGLLSACWDWAGKQGWVEENPWSSVNIKVPPKQKPRPFTEAEVKSIVKTFRQHPHYRYYGDFVDFLFSTGCRIGEAIALQWKHFEPDCSRVWIGVTYSRGTLKEAKRNRDRTVLLTQRIQQMLLRRRTDDFDPEALVFPAPRGGYLDDHNFRNRAWTEVIKEAGITYRMPRNNRHTVVSHGLAQGIDPGEISQQTGHSIKTMLQNYAGNIKSKPRLPDLVGDLDDEDEDL